MSETVQANKKTVLLAMSEWRLLGLREMVVYAVQAVVMRGGGRMLCRGTVSIGNARGQPKRTGGIVCV